MEKPNYQLKSKLLNEKASLIAEVNSINHRLYRADNYSQRDDLNYMKAILIYQYGESIINECERITHAFYYRVKRLRERISSYLVSGKNLFLTLTFNDHTLETTSAETRRVYVRRFLKQHSDCFVANIDFGEDNHREHYHAVIKCDRVEQGSWPYGFMGFEKIRVSKNDTARLSKYISKLSNHAIKETTKRSVLIYSRKSSL